MEPGTFECGMFVEPWEPESLCGTVVEPGTFMKPQKCGTLEKLNFMWNLCGSSNLLSVEPFCGTLGNLNRYVEPSWNLEPFGSGTFMWNLGEPELLRVES